MKRLIVHVVLSLIAATAAMGAQADDTFDKVPAASQRATGAESRIKTVKRGDHTTPSNWRLAMGLNYAPASTEGKFEESVASAGELSIKGNATINLDPGAAVVIEARKMKPNSWGALAGLNYELERKVNKVKFNFEGQIIEGAPADRMQFTTIYGSGVYQWDNFYIPMGINFSMARYKLNSEGKDPEVRGKVGYQIGAGYLINPNFAIEANAWLTTCDLKSVTPDVTIENNKGRFANVLATGKYIF